MKSFISEITEKVLNSEFLTKEEGLKLYTDSDLSFIMDLGNMVRNKIHKHKKVGWIIDRNVNYTNVCISGCKFCNFYCGKNSEKAYTISFEEIKEKIDELILIGGDQLLLQGGLHPELGLSYFIDLFKTLKKYYPQLKLHALGPPEIIHISKLEGISIEETLDELINAGLDSLPGAGAEILSDRVRKIISPKKCSVYQWLEVMKTAHKKNIITSATMMFGHIETLDERIEHLILIRKLQAEKNNDTIGFISFTPWPFQDKNTVMLKNFNIRNNVSAEMYIRTIAISRIMLLNVLNIQASWLTVGKPTAQLCLHAGANDFGSIMIEENVVSVAGANNKFDKYGIQEAIKEAGFQPVRRNQKFEWLE